MVGCLTPVHAEDSTRLRARPLHFRGGCDLVSANARFGGLSALLVSEDGARLTAAGEALITLISDDYFRATRRTLPLVFALEE